MISALILGCNILLSISRKLQSLRTWCETSWRHCCGMVEFLNFLSDPGASHKSILLIILCEIRVLGPFMRCTLVYIRIKVLRFVTCGQARLVVWCRVAGSCKATIHFGVEAGRSFRSWWMKTCHLRLLTALFRRSAQIHSLSRHHTDDIVLTCVDSLAPCGCSTPQVVLIIELVVACGAIVVVETGLPPARSLRHRPISCLIALDVAWDAYGSWCVHDFFDIVGLIKGCSAASILGIHIIIVCHESVYLSLILHVVVLLIVVWTIVSGILNTIDVTRLRVAILSLGVVGISRGITLWTRAVDVAYCANLASTNHSRWLSILTYKDDEMHLI